MKKLKLFAWVIFAMGSTALAQEHGFTCGHTNQTKKLWDENPQLKTDYEQLIAGAKQTSNVNGIQKTTYTIPIVFHILHEYGNENITDAQVYNQVDILNRDFRKRNADTSLVIDEFENIIADCNIEFRLATIDPWGNCTNGIDHIYTHETSNGDDFSKLNQWHRSKYLNVWVCRSMRDGVAGYAYYPTDIAGIGFFADGIIILNQYIGSIGTGNVNFSRALTHEIGHYLGLAHPWGSTNSPGVACGDDGVEDTPLTKGFDFCPTTTAQASVCDPNIVENYQNYMDYSYCSNMFTNDQAEIMQNVLQFLERKDLWSDTNLEITGALINPAPLCKPVAEFNPQMNLICEGDAITFKDASWNAVVSDRLWIFEDGTPATSTSATPSVSFTGFGPKRVTLIVSNAAGSDTISEMISVFNSQGWAEKTGPFFENFNTGNALTYNNWLVEDYDGFGETFEISSNGGRDGSQGFALKNFKPAPTGNPFTAGNFYQNRLGGSKDAIISPSIDLSNTTNAELVFDYAYATNATTLSNITENIKVYVSRNCGKTWLLRKTIEESELITAGFAGGLDFVPTSSQWKTVAIPLVLNNTDSRNRYKIEFTASDFSNNVYIDNIRITGTLGIEEDPFLNEDVVIYPNPKGNGEALHVAFNGNGEKVNVEIRDIQGKILFVQAFETQNGATDLTISPESILAKGYYMLSLKQGDFQTTRTFIQE